MRPGIGGLDSRSRMSQSLAALDKLNKESASYAPLMSAQLHPEFSLTGTDYG